MLKIPESIDQSSYCYICYFRPLTPYTRYLHVLKTTVRTETTAQTQKMYISQGRRLCESADSVKVLNLVHPQALTIFWQVLKISESSNSHKNIKAQIVLNLGWNICQLQSFPPLLRGQNIQRKMTTHVCTKTEAQAALSVHLQKGKEYSISTSSFRQSTGRLKISWPLQKT